MNNKILETVKSFDELSVNPEVFISPSKNFRCRIEFGYKNDCYTMMDAESQIFFSKSSFNSLNSSEILSNVFSGSDL